MILSPVIQLLLNLGGVVALGSGGNLAINNTISTGQILVINDGRIIEHGAHQNLLDQDGFYANLYNSQFDE